MIGGKQHTLVSYEQTETIQSEYGEGTYTWRYRCLECGQKFQKRNPSPSCTIDFVLQIERLAAEIRLDDHLARTPAYDAGVMDAVVKRRLRWPVFRRERFIRDWTNWREFKKEGQVGAT